MSGSPATQGVQSSYHSEADELLIPQREYRYVVVRSKSVRIPPEWGAQNQKIRDRDEVSLSQPPPANNDMRQSTPGVRAQTIPLAGCRATRNQRPRIAHFG